MSTYPLHPLSRFTTPGAAIKRPTEIAYFSYDTARRLHLNSTLSLRYYYTPPLGVSLSEGFETFQELDDSADEHLEGLLAGLEGRERERGCRETGVGVVTWRGLMVKIMTAPYSKFDGFEMNATFFQGTIFIEESKSYKLQSRAQQDSQLPRPGMASQELMSYWGYKFETLCLLPDTWDATPREFIENRTGHVVNNYAQYCSIVQTGIGGTKLVLGGEVDAVWDVKPTDPSQRTNWVELKTSAEIQSDSDVLKFERKLLKFWAQSFLLGVPKIIVGFRSNDAKGTLLRVQEFETTKIPGVVRTQGKMSWDSNVCINFAAAFLDFLKDVIRTDGVWKIRRRERSQVIEVFKQEVTGYGEILTPEFVAWRQELAELENAKAAVLDSLEAQAAAVHSTDGTSIVS